MFIYRPIILSFVPFAQRYIINVALHVYIYRAKCSFYRLQETFSVAMHDVVRVGQVRVGNNKKLSYYSSDIRASIAYIYVENFINFYVI